MTVKKNNVLRAVISTLHEKLLKQKRKNSQEHLYFISSIYNSELFGFVTLFVMTVSDRIFLIKD